MPVPIPADDDTNHWPPDAAEVAFLGRGVITAIKPITGLTPLQTALMRAMFDAMTGHPIDLDAPPIGPEDFAQGLADRSEMFRTRIMQLMILGALVLRPLTGDVAASVEAYAAAMSVDDDLLRVAHRLSEGAVGLAAIDFQRNGYTAEWTSEHRDALHTSRALADAWELCVRDDDLAARWRA